jgi:hypothetical protein
MQATSHYRTAGDFCGAIEVAARVPSRFSARTGRATRLTESFARRHSGKPRVPQTVAQKIMDQVMDRPQVDPKLSEVRAVLQRLQTFSAQPDTVEPQSETSWTHGSFATGRAPAAVALATAGAAALLGFVWLTYSLAGRTPSPAAATPTTSLNGPAIPPVEASVSPPALRPARPKAATEVAQDLLAGGHVQAARKQLLGAVSDGAADVAWMLARSYDPNFLAAIPAADASPDIEQATRWYRAWYAAAVSQGLVPNSVSVERIIRTMH